MLEQILQDYSDELFLKADGFDEAVIGVETSSMRLIYSITKCIEILERDMLVAQFSKTLEKKKIKATFYGIFQGRQNIILEYFPPEYITA